MGGFLHQEAVPGVEAHDPAAVPRGRRTTHHMFRRPPGIFDPKEVNIPNVSPNALYVGDTVNFSRSGPRRRFYAVEIIGFLRRPNIYGEDVRIKFASGLKQLARRDQLERIA